MGMLARNKMVRNEHLIIVCFSDGAYVAKNQCSLTAF